MSTLGMLKYKDRMESNLHFLSLTAKRIALHCLLLDDLCVAVASAIRMRSWTCKRHQRDVTTSFTNGNQQAPKGLRFLSQPLEKHV
jgi:hypothetical protein